MRHDDTSDDSGSEQHDRELIGRARRSVDEARQRAAAAHKEKGDSSPLANLAATLSQPPADSIPGYEIIRELHRGGQGVVYLAIQQSARRKVAIKVMKEGPFASAANKARFEREIVLLGQLKHPHIVTVHDSGVSGGSSYFVMDYVSGQALDAYMAGGERSIEDTLKLFATICEAVNAAHLRGVVHRDLKPGNIRIDLAGEPRILDFGLAKAATGEAVDGQVVTLTGEFIGSLPWASPEQAEGIPGLIDIRTDVYSLGVILYQMLTSKFPYEIVESTRGALNQIIKAEPVKPRTIRKQINDEVETMVLKCLAKERERRYQSAGELARDIRHYLAGEPIEAKRDSTGYILRKSISRHRAGITLIVASLAVTVLTSAAIFLFQYQSEVKARFEREAAIGPHLERASSFQRSGEWYAATLEFQEVLLLDPRHFKALGNLAIVEKEYYYSQGSRNLLLIYDALEKCTDALEIEPGHAGLWNVQGVLLRILDKHQDALGAFERAAELEPKPEPETTVAVLNNWGETLAILGHLAAARTKLERAAALAHECKSPPCYAWRDLAAFQLFGGDSQAAQAIEQAMECMSRDGKPDQAAYRTRAMIRLLLPSHIDVAGALDDAIYADEIAGEADPRTKRVRALAHLRNDEFSHAATQASLAMQNGDLVTPNSLIISIAHARMGDPTRAQESFGRAKRAWPEELKRSGQYQARVDKAILWFDAADDLLQLRATAVDLLETESSDSQSP